MSAPVQRAGRRQRFARLAPWLAAVAALPLLAPTCGGQQPGVKAFSKGSIIVPMDACYQGNAAITPTDCVSAGGTTSDPGDVIKAYGLAYQLIKNDIPVYWVIAQGKTALAEIDATVAYQTGSPVGVYNWASGAVGAMPPNNSGHSIDYRGGPFVVDGTDQAAVLDLFQNGNAATGTPALRTLYSGVKVHVSNVAFQGNVSQVFAGGWNAGGTVAPKLALLNIGSNNAANNDPKNSFPIIQNYLTNANLNFGGAGGTATDTGHGAIYDSLLMADFQPVGTGDWTTSNLGKYQYQVLWVPHWWAPGSCADSSSSPNCTSTRYSTTLIGNVLKTVGGFVRGGNDLMAECAGLGSFEGVWTGASTVHADFGPGDPLSQFQATLGMGIKTLVTPRPAPVYTSFASPLMQIGDFPFAAVTGAIEDYQPSPARGSAFRSGVQQLISTEAAAWNYFTFQPRGAQGGSVAYLAGHDYSSGNLPANFAGERLVLNTLFNLSASCKPRNTACEQLKNLGECRPGTWQCCDEAGFGDITKGYCQVAGEPVCRPTKTPQTEVCNGLDDNCDGIVDNIPASDPKVASPSCYDGDPTTPAGGTPRGTCQRGTWSCQPGTPSPNAPWVCVGQVLPVAEVCNGLDDDCNGTADDNLTPPGGTLSCFTGPPGTVMHATFPPSQCAPGSWACQSTGTPQSPSASWACLGQQLPRQEVCEGALLDWNCNGLVGDGCDCVVGSTRACPWPQTSPPLPPPGVGICRAGTQSCVDVAGRGAWDNCLGQVLPHLNGSTPAEICGNGLDDDCNGVVDDPDQCAECQPGASRKCFPAGASGCVPQPAGGCPAGTTPGGGYCCKGVCAAGDQVCGGGKWGACLGAITPAAAELCNGKNDRCDDNPVDQGGGLTCVISGVNCSDPSDPVNPFQECCVNGSCTRPTYSSESECFPGYEHGTGPDAGKCVAARCAQSPLGTNQPCPPGSVCQNVPALPGYGTCQDTCQGLSCGEGSYCSGGLCVGGGCYATGCDTATTGEVCRNGTCQAEVCDGFTCPPGTFCRGDYAVSPAAPDCVRLCATVVCPVGQACIADGSCAPDPCATTTCAPGQACTSSGTTASCIPDPCPPGHCGANQTCIDGRCTDDPCAGITCPAGICARGQCYASNNPFGYGPASPGSGKAGGCGCGGGDAGPLALLLGLLALPLARPRRRPRGARSPGGPAALAAVALATAALLGGTACSKKTSAPSNCAATCGTDHCVDLNFDAAHCQSCSHACASGEACVDAVCILASPSVPSIGGVSPAPVAAHTTPVLTVTGERFASGARLRVSGAGLAAAEVATTFGSSTQISATVDLTTAAVGKLSLQVVNPDRTISNAAAVDVVTPTPSITSLSPSTAVAGAQPLVQVTGTGITPSAICVQRSGTAEIAIPPQAPATPTRLDCQLDLTAVSPGTLEIMIQNENNVRSPPASFDVTTSTPTISSPGLSPNPAAQGEEIRLTVTGSGFVPGCRVQIQVQGNWNDLPTTFVASTRLQAALSLSQYAAGDYPVRVSAPGATPSAPRVTSAPAVPPLTVSPGPPVATGLTLGVVGPRLGDLAVELDLSGAGFTSACAVQVLPFGSASWTTHPVTTLAATGPSLLRGLTDLTGTEGTWYARGSCGSGCGSPPCLTSAFPFIVATNVASLASVTPAGGAQATSVPVTVTGQNFIQSGAGMKLRLSGVAGDIATVPDGTSPATRATASIPLSGADVGPHTLVAVNPGATPSNSIAFSVTPGTPAISGVAVTDYCPTPSTCNGACTPATNCSPSPSACAVQQSRPVTVTISGSNFGTGLSTVFATPLGLPKVDVSTVPGCSVTIVSASSIAVVLDTTQVLATTYTLSVENPGSPPPGGWPSVAFRVSSTTCF